MSEKIRLYSLIEDSKDSGSSCNNDIDDSMAAPEVSNHYDLLKRDEPVKTYKDGRSRRPRHKMEVTTTRFIQENNEGDECTKKMIILRKEQRGNIRRSRISLVEEKLLAVCESKSTTW